MQDDKKVNEFSSLILSIDSQEERYLINNFGKRFFVTRVVDNNKVISLQNTIGIIKLGEVTYRFYSKVSNLIKVFSMLEKVHGTEYKFKKNKKFWHFDPKTLVDIEQGMNFTEQLISMFISELWKVKKIGFSKTYNSKEENLNYLKGRLFIGKQIKYNVVPKKFYCNYNELNYLTAENLILFEIINKLIHLSIDSKIKSELIYFKNEFAQALNIERRINLKGIKYKATRLNMHYETIMYLSEMFLQKRFFSTLESGENLFCNFLIKMDDLFEKYILLLVKEIIENFFPKYRVEEQVNLNFVRKYDEKLDRENGFLTMIPDIIIYNKISNKPIVVIDTKYVDITNKNKLNNNAYYQMLSYMFSLHLQNETLVTGILLSHGTSGHTYRINHREGQHMHIYTGSVDLLNTEEKIKDSLKLMLDKVLPN